MKLLIGFLFFSQISVAVASPADIATIVNLSSQINIAAKNTKASDSQLKFIIQNLQTSLNTLNTATGSTVPNTGECFNFAYSKYYGFYGSVDATNKAVAACKKIADLSIAQFFYNKYYGAYSSVDAMDEAAQRADQSVLGKLDMIQFAYSKYYGSYSSIDASNTAYKVIVPVSAGSLGCLQMLYPKYYGPMSAVDAMNATAAACVQ